MVQNLEKRRKRRLLLWIVRLVEIDQPKGIVRAGVGGAGWLVRVGVKSAIGVVRDRGRCADGDNMRRCGIKGAR